MTDRTKQDESKKQTWYDDHSYNLQITFVVQYVVFSFHFRNTSYSIYEMKYDTIDFLSYYTIYCSTYVRL